ncbi:uncharacterized protein NDAI_0K00353 [Naumovozyma dairenensis CBS 421]|uniref:RNA-directed DNA polymerase n=1 Tax=Naumovozyma dairenensis (strain ATCC 10597 / BCRC 20456 / CBS 421 / NBRC 0211 / NRRL Y-12639) TaxID=1071378 RepID=G0WHG4_NAUDC|nr:hypothetical protein NDAI_0K00353 [Naumovozyma dairenensis CBS 421]CCD27225.1 hypothetical protein NDAI_0K00353 [Naumovozyma dairenensis CBS 421]
MTFVETVMNMVIIRNNARNPMRGLCKANEELEATVAIPECSSNDDLLVCNLESHTREDPLLTCNLESHEKEDPRVTTTKINPPVEDVCIVNIGTKSRTLEALIDTGSPTHFIRSDVVTKLDLKTSQVPFRRVKGLVSDAITTCNTACRLDFRLENREFDICAYVTDIIKNDVLIGYPFVKRHPSLMESIHKNIDNVKFNNRPVSDPGRMNYEDVTYGKDPIDDICNIETDENWIDIQRDASDVIIVEVTEVTNKDESKFDTIPEELQVKYRGIVRNDLPPRQRDHKHVSHSIELKEGSRLPRRSPYRLTPKKQKDVDEIIKDLLDKGFIVPSKSSYSSPIVLVTKHDGSYRLCVDYRELNKVTVKDPFPLPHVDELLGKVGSASVFTTLDLHSGYHQIPMNPTDMDKTAFVTPTGKYEYTVMPFGLVNAPSTFARYMADLFRDLEFVNVYLDDILIFSNDLESHWKHIDVVLSRLDQEKLIAKKKKCHFAQSEVQFLGYIIGRNKIKPVQEKCEAINRFPVPKTIKEAQRFVGMINYYRKFIKDCSRKVRPLVDFISRNVPWGDLQDDAFATLKRDLMSEPLLVPFKRDAEYRLTTDASMDGLGAVLEEVADNKVLGVVSYYSKSLNETQRRYPPGELELMAIIEGLEHFKYMLHGKHFVLRTDHISLLSIQNQKEPARRVQRWLDTLSEFDFSLAYLPGPKNVVADAISRAKLENKEVPSEPVNDNKEILTVATADTLHTLDPESWTTDWRTDPWGAAVLKSLDDKFDHEIPTEQVNEFTRYLKKFERTPEYLKHFKWTNDVLYYEDRICVPHIRRPLVMETYHDHKWFGGHFGEHDTFKKISEIYFWPNCYKTVQDYVKSCIQCQVMKAHRPRSQGLHKPLSVPSGRWLDISMDFLTGIPTTLAGWDMIMVVIDRFTKRAHFVACKKVNGSTGVFDALFRFVFSLHGFPRTIVSDRDIRFTSNAYRELTDRLGIKLLMSTSNHPQTDGQTERVNRTLNQLLRMYCSNDQSCWDKLLPHVEYVYNSTYQRVLCMSPFEADLGYKPNEPRMNRDYIINARHLTSAEYARDIDALTLRTKDQLEENQLRQEYDANKNRTPVNYKIGDYVLLHRDAYFTGGKYRKIQAIYLGPFQVVGVGTNCCELDLPSMRKLHRMINVTWLKPYVERTNTYPKWKPRAKIERLQRLEEITSIIGYSLNDKIYYCKMKDVDPRLTVEYPEEELRNLSKPRLDSLLRNFNQLETEEEKPVE